LHDQHFLQFITVEALRSGPMDLVQCGAPQYIALIHVALSADFPRGPSLRRLAGVVGAR
jgi:hypothetical protein